MVKTKTELKKIIKEYVHLIRKDIDVHRIILFGSYASGNPKDYSDIDIIVVSPDFKGKKYIDNIQYLFRKAAKVSSFIEPIPATPDEIENYKDDVFFSVVLKNGKVLM